MVRQLEAVYEKGVLRPLEPLFLPEHQNVTLTIDDDGPVSKELVNHRYAEQAWLKAHGRNYVGLWVALDGDTLVATGPGAVGVRDEEVAKGMARPGSIGHCVL